MRLLTYFLLCSTLPLAACVFDASVAKDTKPTPLPEGMQNGGTPAPSSSTPTPPSPSATSTTPSPSEGLPSAGPVKSGSVFASVLPPTPGNPSGASHAFGIFQDGATRASTCLERREGACDVVTCPASTAPSTRPTPRHAGTLNVGGVDVAWDSSRSQYNYTSRTGVLWSAGQALTIEAAGGDLPAFNGVLTFPAQLAITSPAHTPGRSSPLIASKASGIALVWGNIDSEVELSLSESSNSGASISVRCTVPPPSSGFTVPAAAIRSFSTVPTASGGPTHALQLTSVARRVLTVDGYAITLTGIVAGATWEPTFTP